MYSLSHTIYPSYVGPTLTVGQVTLNINERSATIGKSRLSLRRKEFDLLHYLMLHNARIVTKAELRFAVWGSDKWSNSNTLCVQVSNLRSNLSKTADFNPIKTVYGVGYVIKLTE